MLQTMINQFIEVGAINTRLIGHGLEQAARISSESFVLKDIVIMIPGNPGLIGFYDVFMEEIFSNLKKKAHVVGISHAGHDACFSTATYGCPNLKDRPDVYTLEGQIKHKIDFIDKYIPHGSRICFIGHSIGSKITLALMSYLDQSRPNDPKPTGYLLFPTIERMAETPQGRRLWPMLGPLRTPVVYASYMVHYMPDFVKNILISWFVTRPGSTTSKSIADAVKTIVYPHVLEKSLYMAHDELAVVRELEIDPLMRHGDRIRAYYGTDDHWCPVEYHANIVQSVPGIRAYLCEHGYEHAFVLQSSEAMADKVCGWLEEDWRLK